jgi:hypothetical protein
MRGALPASTSYAFKAWRLRTVSNFTFCCIFYTLLARSEWNARTQWRCCQSAHLSVCLSLKLLSAFPLIWYQPSAVKLWDQFNFDSYRFHTGPTPTLHEAGTQLYRFCRKRSIIRKTDTHLIQMFSILQCDEYLMKYKENNSRVFKVYFNSGESWSRRQVARKWNIIKSSQQSNNNAKVFK